MCGICGKIAPRGVDTGDIGRMSQILSHRGPDDEGAYIKDGVGLGIRRLSIIDLVTGNQPISNEDDTIWVVLNGEIYNYQELYSELKKKGHRFKTRSDTEVILHLYEEYGRNCVDRLRGMFAFAIWDEPEKALLLARDRLGQKPLYYWCNGSTLIFGSEIKALLQNHEVERSLDIEAMHDYLSLRFVPPPLTMFEGIRKLPPGHTLLYRDNRIDIQRYWDLVYYPKLLLPEAEIVAALKELLLDTVRIHMVSDVPLGAFLSGGMDSSLIVALMSHVSEQPIQTFSVGVAEADFNELPYARLVVEQYGSDHHELMVKPNFITLLPEMTWFLDEPSDPIAACMYHVSKLASQHVKVTLGGDGGDEMFAGFDRYYGYKFVDYYQHLPHVLRKEVLGRLIRRFPDTFTYKSLTQRIRWFHELSFFSGGERYAATQSFFRFGHHLKRQLYTPLLWSTLANSDSKRCIVEKFNASNAEDLLDKMLYADIQTRLPEHSLIILDRLAMAHSLEGRSPLLDHKVAEFAASIPSNLKLKGNRLKYIQREVATQFLPSALVNRSKQGFMFPLAYWFKNELRDVFIRMMSGSRMVAAGYFNGDFIRQLIDDHSQGKVDHHVRLWMLLNLELWYRMFIEGEGRDGVAEDLAKATEARERLLS